jgi:hypothetical protein
MAARRTARAILPIVTRVPPMRVDARGRTRRRAIVFIAHDARRTRAEVPAIEDPCPVSPARPCRIRHLARLVAATGREDKNLKRSLLGGRTAREFSAIPLPTIHALRGIDRRCRRCGSLRAQAFGQQKTEGRTCRAETPHPGRAPNPTAQARSGLPRRSPPNNSSGWSARCASCIGCRSMPRCSRSGTCRRIRRRSWRRRYASWASRCTRPPAASWTDRRRRRSATGPSPSPGCGPRMGRAPRNRCWWCAQRPLRSCSSPRWPTRRSRYPRGSSGSVSPAR